LNAADKVMPERIEFYSEPGEAQDVLEYMDIRKLIKKLLGKRGMADMPPAPWEVSKICIKCLESIPKENIVCNKCAHNQSLPVQKRTGSIKDISKKIVAGVTEQQNIDIELICNFSNFGSKPVKNEVLEKEYIEIMIAKLAISYILFLESYRNNYNYKNIIDALENEIDHLFSKLFKDSDDVWRYFNYMLNKYLDAFKDDNPVKSIANILKIGFERTIAGQKFPVDFLADKISFTKPLKLISKEDVFPSWYPSMPYEIFVGYYIEFFTLWKNKWEIE
jgi:hypothetical protein